jgi:hypothetical protein
MAKRARGTGRPGQQSPLQRSRRRASSGGSKPSSAAPVEPQVAPPAAAPPTGGRRLSGGLTEDEETRAAQLEAAILAEERAAQETSRRTKDRTRAASMGPREVAPLTVRAAEEYAYVRRDIVKITRVGLGLLVALAVLYILIEVTGLIQV